MLWSKSRLLTHPVFSHGWFNSGLGLASCREVPVLSQPCCGQCCRVVAGRTSCSREIPALERCVSLLVFTDILFEVCSCKHWIKEFYRGAVKKHSKPKQLLRYPLAADVPIFLHQWLQGTGQRCSASGLAPGLAGSSKGWCSPNQALTNWHLGL